MDILSAFYRIGLAEESGDLTSFTVPDGCRWRYTILPMGLSNIFSDKSRFHSLVCYVDDIMICSNDWSSHLQQSELALRTLQENDISCSPTKTEIGFAEVEYLSADSVRISEKRIESVHKIQAPKNVNALQR